jgi:hypothetical protein
VFATLLEAGEAVEHRRSARRQLGFTSFAAGRL